MDVPTFDPLSTPHFRRHFRPFGPRKNIQGFLGTAFEHIAKLETGGPEDPNRNKGKTEVKAAIDRVERLAKRLPGKSQEKSLDVVKVVREKLGAL